MIALVTTYFLVFYILVPGILFRFVTSWYVQLKLFERTRTQEATFAVAVALLPFVLALFGVWHLPQMKHYPFAVEEKTYSELRMDYHRVTALLTSSDASKFLTANPPSTPSAESEANWQALNRVLRRQARFLTWYFLVTACEGLVFGFLASKYGDWKIVDGPAGQRRHPPLIRFYNWIAPRLILPNISEWYMLLTNFSWPKRERIFVRADILQIDGHLYKGSVVDYFIDSAGKLSGIQLDDVSRFDRQAYLDAKSKAGPDNSVSSTDFWKNIPSSRFYIGQASISNLNVRFVPRDETLISLAEKVLEETNTRVDGVSVASEEDPGFSNSQHPDIYS